MYCHGQRALNHADTYKQHLLQHWVEECSLRLPYACKQLTFSDSPVLAAAGVGFTPQI